MQIIPIDKKSIVLSVTRERMFRGLREEVEATDLDFTLLGSLVVKIKNDGMEEPVSFLHLDN